VATGSMTLIRTSRGDDMSGGSPSVRTEREVLVAYLVTQRAALKYAAYGLTEEQLRRRPTASALSVGGLIKHAASMERGWTRRMLGQPEEEGGLEEYAESFAMADDETAATLMATFDQVAEETEAAIASLPDLGSMIQLPAAPWLPDHPEGFAVRWILLHVIEELARHAGHADIIRESIDGATTSELMAGAEGWPETDWVKPFRPPSVLA
jgi:uncharacterized damage-inducible protein DinB